jgi:hypothetical protein
MAETQKTPGKRQKTASEKENIILKRTFQKIQRGTLTQNDPEYPFAQFLLEPAGKLVMIGAELHRARERAKEIMAMIDNDEHSLGDFYNLDPVDGFTVLEILVLSNNNIQEKASRIISDQRSILGKKGARGRHARDADKRRQIQAKWAEGNFSTRNRCAEEEFAALGMSYETARKALKGQPDPDPWPAAPAGKRARLASAR